MWDKLQEMGDMEDGIREMGDRRQKTRAEIQQMIATEVGRMVKGDGRQNTFSVILLVKYFWEPNIKYCIYVLYEHSSF